MKYQLIALLLSLAHLLPAQAPGYLGKRIFIKSEVGSMFALSNPTANNHGRNTYGEQGNSLGLNTKFGLQAGYALSRRHLLALEGNYLRTGMSLRAYTPAVLYDSYSDEHYLFYQLSGPEAGIGIHLYNPIKGSIAPMGFYTAFRLRMAFLKGKILDKKTTYAQNDATGGHEPLGIDARYNHLSAGIEFGQHIIVFDRLLLSISAEANIPAIGFTVDNNEKFNPELGNQNAFNRAAFERIRGYSVFMVKIGVGLLL